MQYIEHLDWPEPPESAESYAAREIGEEFHRLMQRHFLGFSEGLEGAIHESIADLWATFKQSGPSIPDGSYLPELQLTVPLGNHQLTGRIDLAVIGSERITMFDWKTGRPPLLESELAESMQTRVYLALMTEGGQAIGVSLPAESLSLSFWYTRQPERMPTFTYDSHRHEKSWNELEAIATDIDLLLASSTAWPLADDLALCSRCPYNQLCQRTPAQQLNAYSEQPSREEDEELREPVFLEPPLP